MLSVVIPTRGADDLIDSCLAALSMQTARPDEVIIVDDGDTDWIAVGKSADSWGLGNSVRVVNGLSAGFSSAVNIGLAQALGSVVVVLNNDCQPAPRCFESLLGSLEADPTAAAASPVLDDPGLISIRHEFVRNMVGIAGDQPEGPLLAVEGRVMSRVTPNRRTVHLPWTCVALTRRALDLVGDLNEEFESGLYADDDWHQRCSQHGMHALIDTNAFASHMESETFRRQKIDYRVKLNKTRQHFLDGCHVLACVLTCDRKGDGAEAIQSIHEQSGIKVTVYRNHEGQEPDDSFNADWWGIDGELLGDMQPGFDQDQHYRLPRIIAARNMALDVMRLNSEFTHLMFVDSDVTLTDPGSIRRLVLWRQALIGGAVPGRGSHSHVHMKFGPREELHSGLAAFDWGTCGCLLLDRLVAMRTQFRWGSSELHPGEMRSEDPALGEWLTANDFGRWVIDESVICQHNDPESQPLTGVAQF